LASEKEVEVSRAESELQEASYTAQDHNVKLGNLKAQLKSKQLELKGSNIQIFQKG
jgi:hypothetical protein